MTRLVLALVLVATGRAGADRALPTIDDAFPPAIRVHGVSNVALEPGDVTWLTFTLGSRDPAALYIDVPSGTRVVGIDLVSGDQRSWGAADDASHAASALRAASSGTLVEWNNTSGGEDHLLMRHAARDCSDTDVVRPCIETISLALVLPAIERVRLEPGRVIALAPRGDEQATTPHVDEVTSLVVLPAIRQVFVPTPEPRSLDAHMIRLKFREHAAQLRWCYEQALQREPTLAGTATLHVRIDADGRVGSSEVDGDVANPAVFDCLVHEVASWEFPATDETVEFNYPLMFRRAGA